jgi:hypothetical protein
MMSYTRIGLLLVALGCPACSLSWFVCTWCMTCRSHMRHASAVRKHYICFHCQESTKRRYKCKRSDMDENKSSDEVEGEKSG